MSSEFGEVDQIQLPLLLASIELQEFHRGSGLRMMNRACECGCDEWNIGFDGTLRCRRKRSWRVILFGEIEDFKANHV